MPLNHAGPDRARHPRGGRLTLLPGCDLRVAGEVVPLGLRARRLLAFLAIRGCTSRTVVAGTLWPEVTDARAHASLRSTLHELSRLDPQVLLHATGTLRLAPAVRVDWLVARRVAHRVVQRDGHYPGAISLLRHDLLAYWSEPWLADEQLAFQQLRVHALELLCRRLSADGRHALAVEAGLLAVASEPLRESAHRVLIGAHLAEGNRFDAREQYRRCALLLRTELDVEPTPELRRLLAPERPALGIAL